MKSAFLVSKRLLCLYDKQNNAWLLIDIEFIFWCSTRHLTRSLRSLVSYRVKRSKRNSISTRAHVLFSIYNIARAQEARVALGCALSNSHASLVISNFPRASMTRYAHAKHGSILHSQWTNYLSLFNSQRWEWWVYVRIKISDCWAFRLFETVPGCRAFSNSEINWTHLNLLSWVQLCI